jgi:branched-chain amino acid transport system substrate-binding protein
VRTISAVLAATLLIPQWALAADPIKVGVPIALSPPGSVPQATQVRDGLTVTAKMINDAGGVLGRPIELGDRFYESCQKGGIHLWFSIPM